MNALIYSVKCNDRVRFKRALLECQCLSEVLTMELKTIISTLELINDRIRLNDNIVSDIVLEFSQPSTVPWLKEFRVIFLNYLCEYEEQCTVDLKCFN